MVYTGHIDCHLCIVTHRVMLWITIEIKASKDVHVLNAYDNTFGLHTLDSYILYSGISLWPRFTLHNLYYYPILLMIIVLVPEKDKIYLIKH